MNLYMVKWRDSIGVNTDWEESPDMAPTIVTSVGQIVVEDDHVKVLPHISEQGDRAPAQYLGTIAIPREAVVGVYELDVEDEVTLEEAQDQQKPNPRPLDARRIPLPPEGGIRTDGPSGDEDDDEDELTLPDMITDVLEELASGATLGEIQTRIQRNFLLFFTTQKIRAAMNKLPIRMQTRRDGKKVYFPED